MYTVKQMDTWHVHNSPIYFIIYRVSLCIYVYHTYFTINHQAIILCITGHHYPTPKQLQNILKPDTSGLAAQWYDLGTQLLTADTVGTLDVIKTDHSNDASACCNKMFVKWLELQPSATWSQLIIALGNIGMNLAAENVIKYLVKGELYSYNICLVIYDYIRMYIHVYGSQF